MRLLLHGFGRGDCGAVQALRKMDKVSYYFTIWVTLSIICYPISNVVLPLQPSVSSANGPDLVILLFAVCVWILARASRIGRARLQN